MYMNIKNIFIWTQRRSNVLPTRRGRQTELQQCNTAFFFIFFFLDEDFLYQKIQI